MFDKEEYWKRREESKRGQGEKPVKAGRITRSNPAELAFDNDGNIIIKNRNYRRRRIKLPGWSIFTRHQVTKEERKKLRKRGRN